MESEKAEEEDAAPQHYVASYNFIASGSDQVRETNRDDRNHNQWKNVKITGGIPFSLRFVPNSLVSAAATRCSFTPSLRRSGGGQSCEGSEVMSPPVTSGRVVMLRRRMTRRPRTLGKTRNTSAVIAHWLDTKSGIEMEFLVDKS